MTEDLFMRSAAVALMTVVSIGLSWNALADLRAGVSRVNFFGTYHRATEPRRFWAAISFFGGLAVFAWICTVIAAYALLVPNDLE